MRPVCQKPFRVRTITLGTSRLRQNYGMSSIRTIEPDKWSDFLAGFSSRNRGRRARFESFSRGGVFEEDEEAVFEKAEISDRLATVTRTNRSEAKPTKLTAEITDVRGISVQYDTDNSENTLEFMETNGDMTVLHFESMVDGGS